jgi:hypothetical protein
MKTNKLIKSRQSYNYDIIKLLYDNYPQFSECFPYIEEAIDKYPQQRFGQIICNYICSDYRDNQVSLFTTEFFNTIFPNDPDPFFEESKETFKRLSQ